jgi:type I restriction enzyme M protein
MLKVGGRCGVVIKNTFLSNTDNASITLRKQLLEECDLQAVLDLPKGAFTGTGVQTVVLFFEKGRATDKVWFYQLNLSRNLGKTNSLNGRDLEEFVKLFKNQGDSENSWSVNVNDIDKSTWDLTATNPNRKEAIDNRTPKEILAEIKALDEDVAEAMKAIEELL